MMKTSKHKIIIDPDGDGDQWLYREILIMNQKHPKLLPYACYDLQRDSFLIGVTTSKALAKKLIDNYIDSGKKQVRYIIYTGQQLK